MDALGKVIDDLQRYCGANNTRDGGAARAQKE
jgi:hypothetical protein